MARTNEPRGAGDGPAWGGGGSSEPTGPPPGPGGGPPRNGLGISALILGIIGLLTGLIPLLFWAAGALGITALVLGIVGARRASQGYATNGRVSVVGAVLGGLAIVLSIVGVVIVLDAVEDLGEELETTEVVTPSPGEAAEPAATP